MDRLVRDGVKMSSEAIVMEAMGIVYSISHKKLAERSKHKYREMFLQCLHLLCMWIFCEDWGPDNEWLRKPGLQLGANVGYKGTI